jgi:hypothetical protein
MQKVRAGEAAPLTGTYRCVACGYKVELKKDDRYRSVHLRHRETMSCGRWTRTN